VSVWRLEILPLATPLCSRLYRNFPHQIEHEHEQEPEHDYDQDPLDRALPNLGGGVSIAP
jgi:hypothetical protein